MPKLAHLRIGGMFRGPSLRLERLPRFLRFVVRGSDWKTLDALDQLDDKPEPGETVIAAEWTRKTTVHIDRVKDGKRIGEWLDEVTYEYVEPQPSQDVLRDSEAWHQWCMEQVKAGAK